MIFVVLFENQKEERGIFWKRKSENLNRSVFVVLSIVFIVYFHFIAKTKTKVTCVLSKQHANRLRLDHVKWHRQFHQPIKIGLATVNLKKILVTVSAKSRHAIQCKFNCLISLLLLITSRDKEENLLKFLSV